MIDNKLYKTHRSPYGFHFLDAETSEKIDKIIFQVEDILKNDGFKKIIPASVDYPETFEIFNAEDSIRFRDKLGDDLALRNDATVSVIKGITNHLDTHDLQTREHRYYYVVPVFKDIKKSYPANREIIQLGVEWIGLDKEGGFLKLIQLAEKLLKNVFSMDYTLVMGDVGIFHALRNCIQNPYLKKAVLYRNAPFLAEILREAGWEQAEEISLKLLFPEETWADFASDMITRVSHECQKKFFGLLTEKSTAWENARRELTKKGIHPHYDPLLIRKADYYSGTLFEFYLDGINQAPLRGGSYDGLIKEYSHLDLPASGFALDISSLV